MIDLQLEQAWKELRDSGYGWVNGEFHKGTRTQQRREKELDCIEMINSILAYNWSGHTAEQIMQMQENSYYNYLARYVKTFGRKKVVKLIQEQIDSISCINKAVHTDSEGNKYNSITWKE